MTDQVLVSKSANCLVEEAQWVGGRIILTERQLTFRPNAINRAVQDGLEMVT
jgi:hypothetical protein